MDARDPYTLALVCNALLALDPEGQSADPFLEHMLSSRQNFPRGDLVWWENGAAGQTLYYGSGRAGNVETTALAVLALLAGQRNPAAVRRSGLAGGAEGRPRHLAFDPGHRAGAQGPARGDRPAPGQHPATANRHRPETADPLPGAAHPRPDQAEVVQLVRLPAHLGPGRTAWN